MAGRQGKRQLQAGRRMWEVLDNAALSLKGETGQCRKGVEAPEPEGQWADELLGQ